MSVGKYDLSNMIVEEVDEQLEICKENIRANPEYPQFVTEQFDKVEKNLINTIHLAINALHDQKGYINLLELKIRMLKKQYED